MQRSRKARMRRKQRRRWYIALLSFMVFVLSGSLFFFLNSTTDQHQQSAYDLNQQNQSRYDLNLSFDGHFNSKFHNETRNKLRELEHKRYWDTSTEDFVSIEYKQYWRLFWEQRWARDDRTGITWVWNCWDYSENKTMLSRRWQTREIASRRS